MKDIKIPIFPALKMSKSKFPFYLSEPFFLIRRWIRFAHEFGALMSPKRLRLQCNELHEMRLHWNCKSRVWPGLILLCKQDFIL